MRTFRTFRQVHKPQIQVELFDEIVAAMRGDCLKKGDEWHTAAPNEDFLKPKNISARRFEHFSSNRSPNLVLTHILEKCSKRRSDMFFRVSKTRCDPHCAPSSSAHRIAPSTTCHPNVTAATSCSPHSVRSCSTRPALRRTPHCPSPPAGPLTLPFNTPPLIRPL